MWLTTKRWLSRAVVGHLKLIRDAGNVSQQKKIMKDANRGSDGRGLGSMPVTVLSGVVLSQGTLTSSDRKLELAVSAGVLGVSRDLA